MKPKSRQGFSGIRCFRINRPPRLSTDSWQAALKNALRQAPDVIVIGEIRDRETMEHAVAFAETGHLCFATLHANSANQALFDLYQQKKISYEDAVRFADSANDLRLHIMLEPGGRKPAHATDKSDIHIV